MTRTAILVDVFFDDFKVTHQKSPIVEAQDFYPFGLTYNNFTREDAVPNRWKFQGQEHIDDLGLNWDSFKWRNHQPDIGRFFNVDPLAEDYYYNSPYAFSENKVIAHIELEGLEAKSIQEQALDNELQKVEGVWNSFVGSVKSVVQAIDNAMHDDDGPPEIVKQNQIPIKVDAKQRDAVSKTTDLPQLLDGNTNPQYNPDATAKGNPEADQVVTQEGGMTKTENPNAPSASISIDSIWTGRGAKIVTEYADTIKGEVIVEGDTMMVVEEIRTPDYKKKK